MTETTKTVFEQYEVRKTKKQKTAFIEYVTEMAARYGYDCKVEKGAFGVRNIVIGDPDQAKVLYTAHYDTCARLPFPNFITPKIFLIYMLYQLLIVALFFAAAFVLGAIFGLLIALTPDEYTALRVILSILPELCYFALLFLMLAGPANKHTANDNTSGVTAVLDLMR